DEKLLADALERFIDALTDHPPRWCEAQKLAEDVVDRGALDADLETLRNAIMRALLPLTYSLPETLGEMMIALKDPSSPHAVALAAARVVRVFAPEFAVH